MFRNNFLLGAAVLAAMVGGAAHAATPGSPEAQQALSFDPFTLTTSATPPAAIVEIPNSASVSGSSATAQPRTVTMPSPLIVGVPDEVDIHQSTTHTTVIPCVVSLNRVSSTTVTVHYTTSGGTASPVYDYVPTSGILTFTPGETSKTVNVTMRQGNAHDNHYNEYFYFILSDATGGATIGSGASKSQETCWIEGALATNLTVVGTTVPHGTTGTSIATVKVFLNNGGSSVVKVKIASDDDTAIQGIDYHSISETLTFNPGQTSKTVNITIYGIPGHVPTRDFQVYLSDSVNAWVEYSQFRAIVTLTGH